jgi:protein involved in polysaccharide export with SLBB domain
VFYFKSARKLQNAVNVLGGFLEGTIKGQDIRIRRNKKGDIIALDLLAHVSETTQTGENIVVCIQRGSDKVKEGAGK